MKFDYEGARKAGYSDQDILKELAKKYPDYKVNDALRSGYSPHEIVDYLTGSDSEKPTKEKENLIARGAKIYGKGVVSGAAGQAGDIVNLAKELPPTPFTPPVPDFLNPMGTEGFEEYLESNPETAAERTLQRAGEWGGVGATWGAAGGPIGALSGLAGGSLSGALYQGSQELGAPHWLALALSFAPGAAQAFKARPKGGKGITPEAPPFRPEDYAESAGGPPGGGPPGGGPPPGAAAAEERPFLENILPLHQIEEEIQPIIADEIAAQKNKLKKPPQIVEFKFEEPTNFAHNELELEHEIGRIYSPERLENTTTASRALRQQINTIADEEYSHVNKLYDKSRKANEAVTDLHPELSKKLQEIEANMTRPGHRAKIEKDIAKAARDILKLIGTERTAFKKVSNQKLIGEIQSLNTKINSEYLKGDPSNQYRPLTKALAEAIELASRKNPQAYEAWRKASEAYGNWAERFQSSELYPWRSPANISHSKLLRSIENVDQLLNLESILSRTREGQRLYNQVKRDFIERKLRPYIKNPQSIRNSVEYEETLRELEALVTPKELIETDAALDRSALDYEFHNRYKERHKAAKTEHKRQVTAQKDQLKEYANELKDIEALKAYAEPRALRAAMSSVSGFKKLEKVLSNSEKGRKMIDNLKEYTAERLLTQGKVRADTNPQSWHKLLHDVESKALLEHTLGKDVTDDLRKIVDLAMKGDLNPSSIGSKVKLAKTIGRLVPGVGKFVGAAESVWDIITMLYPAMAKAEYQAIDIETVRELIKNRKEILKAASPP